MRTTAAPSHGGGFPVAGCRKLYSRRDVRRIVFAPYYQFVGRIPADLAKRRTIQGCYPECRGKRNESVRPGWPRHPVPVARRSGAVDIWSVHGSVFQYFSSWNSSTRFRKITVVQSFTSKIGSGCDVVAFGKLAVHEGILTRQHQFRQPTVDRMPFIHWGKTMLAVFRLRQGDPP